MTRLDVQKITAYIHRLPLPTGAAVRPPLARRDDTVDEYHGTTVPDPYQWLEDPESDATRAFVFASNRASRDHLDPIEGRAALHSRLAEIWSYPRRTVPIREQDWLYFQQNDGLQAQPTLMRARSMDDEPELVLDPNLLSDDGTISLMSWAVSPDGRTLVYGLSDGGSDWLSLHVRDLQEGSDHPQVVHHCKFAWPVWLPDSRSFLYGRFPEPVHGVDTNLHQALYLHRLGTEQAEDQRVLDDPDHPRSGFQCTVTDDHRMLVLEVHVGTDERTRVWLRSLDLVDGRSEVGGPLVKLLDDYDAEYSFVTNVGSRLLFKTDLDAPRGRVIEVDLEHPERPHWQELVAEQEDTLLHVSAVGDRLFLETLHHAASRVLVTDLTGSPVAEVPLPELGTAYGFTGRTEHRETWFAFTSLTRPTEIHRFDLDTSTSERAWAPSVPFDPDRFQTHQHFVPSVDGTRVPVFVSTAGEPHRDGDQPTLLYGYGGFNHAISPMFDPSLIAWLELGGAYAVANLRGGGEYGREWHEAGTLAAKQNVFDDFISVGEWLCTEGLTRPARLAIHGRSNGGLLVGATLVQRPDLFGAAVPAVGVLDMLRYHRFTIGWAWASDYGTSEDPDQFEVLIAYSPLHNARPAAYPPTLVLTGDHDDRVVPAHSYKFAAALQHAQQGDAPVLLRVDTRAGHGMGKAVSMVLDERTDMFAFLAHHLGLPLPADAG